LDEFHPARIFSVTWNEKRFCFYQTLGMTRGWWINSTKRLVNDVSRGRLCGARSVVAKVEEYFKGKASKSIELTPELCGWLTCEF
jgi:hypothetical protein